MNAVETTGLVKRYGAATALRELDLAVPQGSVLGLLGPNGAGKTTTVRILTTLLEPDAGTARVAGYDVVREADRVRRVIGLSGQYAAVDENLTGRENLVLFGRLHRMRAKAARARAGELLERIGLAEAADRVVKTYSGGMRRRLDLAASLVIKPRVLFLDEPTTGLDPRGRREIWDLVRDLVADGATLLLTTQYLEEADALADDILILDRGQVIAHGTPDVLKAKVGGERIELTAPDRAELARAAEVLASVADGPVEVRTESGTVTAPVTGGVHAVAKAAGELAAAGVVANDLALRRPTLDEVFLTLTGLVPAADEPPR
ncbi:ATP-binding cassette domain-containing protein [Rhizohabitans arisaemae]|uniref:ATP-binding cassette domain-containing protein n=1 Tax=Rhizohabitans arisaemae TaxID=2720610 RepID=UPI0024B2261A|nr:ATP-binding cassette domain-containing protein [Rhizohabitans arisaemae]